MNALSFAISSIVILALAIPALALPADQGKWFGNWFRPQQTPERTFVDLLDGSRVATFNEGNVVFHAFRQPENSFLSFVNMVEFPSMLYVYDFAASHEAAQLAINYARSLGKQNIMCILSHDHFDHYTGYESWKDVCTSTFALQETIDNVRDQSVNCVLCTNFNESQPSAISFVNNARPLNINADGFGTVHIDGFPVVYERVEYVETEIFLFIRMPRQQAMFMGDNAKVRGHMFFATAKNLGDWLNFVETTKKNYSYRNVLVGHNFPLDWSDDVDYNLQMEYFNFIRDVANTIKTREAYTAAVLERFPDYSDSIIVGYEFLIQGA